MFKRRRTRTINIGGVKVGWKFPVSIQSMAKTDTRDARNTIAEIKRLKKAGCEIVRVAVKDVIAAKSIKTIKRRADIPLVADIHFDYRLAIESIKSGADKIRINPGNISSPNHLKDVIRAAKKRKIPIRIGFNSGSMPPAGDGQTENGDSFVGAALRYIKFFEKENFRDIIVSLKSSDVRETVTAYRGLAARCDYPFHVGITASGAHEAGIVKSSIGIGALLLDGIGDTIRVSLTGDSVSEVVTAKNILQSLSIRNFRPDIVSCPMCGRCQVDLAGIVRKLETELSALNSQKPLTVAVMGCEVNGPGEARQADIGIAFGKDSGVLFRKGKIVKKVKEKNAVKELLKNL
ncbi:MAG: 4-hydroxy-3-methylbut-2-en-1-yl diphosphate synthase [Omnitrophica bacterium RBG_13_46_9]|nr:MAG: 4-hydroxy-3-methylbut-2-en-1-yl diphosphate synthase [Omnitrophica bacterium RBG_13_46_9]